MACYIADEAVVKGDVTLGEDASIWYNAVVRGDLEFVRIGEGSNIQDNAVVHVDAGYPVTIGKGVTIGHGAIIHGCSIGDDSLVGMGAIVLNGAVIGERCIIGAGALVTQNTRIPDESMVYGSPARIIRSTSVSEQEENRINAQHYVTHARDQLPKAQ